MRFQPRRPSAGVAVGAIALFVALGGSAAAATSALSGSSIEKNSVPLNRLTGDARQALDTPGPRGSAGKTGDKGKAGKTGAIGAAGTIGSVGEKGSAGAVGSQGPAGATGTPGPSGATGAQGSSGATGAQGPSGATGTQGPSGAIGAQGPSGATGAQGATGPASGDPNSLSLVGTLGTSRTVAAPAWGAVAGTCTTTAVGSSSLDAAGLEIGVPNDNAFAGAQYNPPTGITLSDLSALSYTERYTRGPTGAGSSDAPFVEIDVVTGASTTASVSFAPYAQHASGGLSPSVWQTWNVLEADSLYSVNHGSSNTPLATVLSTYGTDQVQDIEIEAGCGTGDAGSTSTVSSIQLAAGSQLQNFQFSS